MKVKEMIGALQLRAKRQEPNQLCTIWGERVQTTIAQAKIPKQGGDVPAILDEYPRPQMVREQYTILNGMYSYAFTKSSQFPTVYEGTIVVPFSPETMLSGVERQLKPDEFLWYHRTFQLQELMPDKRLLLHFGACDERCKVYVNQKEVGGHSGGYQSFTFDLTDYVQEGENILHVCVRDFSDTSYHGRGKQKLESGGMFYTAQSGIWQTVWYEWVPETYVEQLYITPCYDENEVKVDFRLKRSGRKEQQESAISCCIEIYDHEKCVSAVNARYEGTPMVLPVPNKKSWSPSTPFLYQIKLQIGEDTLQSYFGMRLFSVEKDVDGLNRLCLNHVPYFQNGVLDQGYWPESLLTPPSDEAMIYDILMAKQMGFNMIRKHCKIEPMRWYYHCDRLGMIVWQDMINGGDAYRLMFTTYIPTVFRSLRKIKDYHYSYTSRTNAKGRKEWKKECLATIDQLYNCTCICTWVLFNEGWGQFDAQENVEMVLKKDNTRIIDAHSGWFDQNAGDLKSEHIYFQELFMEKSEKPYVISEYGGFTYSIEKHSYSENFFGYENYDDYKEFQEGFENLQHKVLSLKTQGLCAAVYTQLTDIEEEVNGLLTYDRKVTKLSSKLLKENIK